VRKIDNENELLTVEEMGKVLKISRSKAYALTKQAGFPVIKFGKCVRISKKDLLKWLQKIEKL